MKQYGLIGYPLSHSFSKKYFSNKFSSEGIVDSGYELFELADIRQLPGLISDNPALLGLNVTIPYKEQVLPFIHRLDQSAKKVGAVNVIKIQEGQLIGYNSDYYGFRTSLDTCRQGRVIREAIILGTGGASKAVKAALDDLGAKCIFVSRSGRQGTITYQELWDSGQVQTADLIVNTTPLGMSPKISESPAIPYQQIKKNAIAFDLIYNPAETEFLRQAKENGAITRNGLEMLELQAEKSWEIWQA